MSLPEKGRVYELPARGPVRVTGFSHVMVDFVSEDGTVAGELPLDEWEKVVAPTGRPSWDDYFIQLCHLVATRATCDRKHVGAVIVRDRRILATGYNGSPPGTPHCDDVGHDLVKLADGSVNCVRTIHAEANAILQAARYGVSLQGTDLYTNTYPCWACAKMILGAGITRVVFDADYRMDARVNEAFVAKSVKLERYKIA